MTKEEAIELLKDLDGAIEDNQGRDYDEAFRMAVKALQKEIERQEMIIKASERYLGLVRCKDCQHANECHKSVQYTRNEPNTVTIGYSSIEWCSKGERKGGDNE